MKTETPVWRSPRQSRLHREDDKGMASGYGRYGCYTARTQIRVVATEIRRKRGFPESTGEESEGGDQEGSASGYDQAWSLKKRQNSRHTAQGRP